MEAMSLLALAFLLRFDGEEQRSLTEGDDLTIPGRGSCDPSEFGSWGHYIDYQTLDPSSTHSSPINLEWVGCWRIPGTQVPASDNSFKIQHDKVAPHPDRRDERDAYTLPGSNSSGADMQGKGGPAFIAWDNYSQKVVIHTGSDGRTIPGAIAELTLPSSYDKDTATFATVGTCSKEHYAVWAEQKHWAQQYASGKDTYDVWSDSVCVDNVRIPSGIRTISVEKYYNTNGTDELAPTHACYDADGNFLTMASYRSTPNPQGTWTGGKYGDTGREIDQFIAGWSCAVPLEVDHVVADETARLALSPSDGDLCHQRNNATTIGQAPSSAPTSIGQTFKYTTSGGWVECHGRSIVDEEVADATARLAISSPSSGHTVLQLNDQSVWTWSGSAWELKAWQDAGNNMALGRTWQRRLATNWGRSALHARVEDYGRHDDKPVHRMQIVDDVYDSQPTGTPAGADLTKHAGRAGLSASEQASWYVRYRYESRVPGDGIPVASVNTASNTITTSTSHGLADGDLVRIWSTGAVVGGVDPNEPYYVKNSTSNTFQLAVRTNFNPISLTSFETSNLVFPWPGVQHDYRWDGTSWSLWQVQVRTEADRLAMTGISTGLRVCQREGPSTGNVEGFRLDENRNWWVFKYTGGTISDSANWDVVWTPETSQPLLPYKRLITSQPGSSSSVNYTVPGQRSDYKARWPFSDVDVIYDDSGNRQSNYPYPKTNNVVSFASSGPYLVSISSVATSDSSITTTEKHWFNDGDPVELTSTGTLPAGLSSGTTYYADRINDTKIKLTSGGSQVTFSDTGTGSHSFSVNRLEIECTKDHGWVSNIDSFSDVATFELVDGTTQSNSSTYLRHARALEYVDAKTFVSSWVYKASSTATQPYIYAPIMKSEPGHNTTNWGKSFGRDDNPLHPYSANILSSCFIPATGPHAVPGLTGEGLLLTPYWFGLLQANSYYGSNGDWNGAAPGKAFLSRFGFNPYTSNKGPKGSPHVNKLLLHQWSDLKTGTDSFDDSGWNPTVVTFGIENTGHGIDSVPLDINRNQTGAANKQGLMRSMFYCPDDPVVGGPTLHWTSLAVEGSSNPAMVNVFKITVNS